MPQTKIAHDPRRSPRATVFNRRLHPTPANNATRRDRVGKTQGMIGGNTALTSRRQPSPLNPHLLARASPTIETFAPCRNHGGISILPLPPLIDATSGQQCDRVGQHWPDPPRPTAKPTYPDPKPPRTAAHSARPNRHETVPIWVPSLSERFPIWCHPTRIEWVSICPNLPDKKQKRAAVTGDPFKASATLCLAA